MIALRVWRNGKIPVVYKPRPRLSLLVRVPYAQDNHIWLRGDGRRIHWVKQFRAWQIPRSRFDDVVARCLDRYQRTYIIEAYRAYEQCAPACWNALGYDCECSCLGANHGSGHELRHVISETFAFEWGARKLACRLIQKKRP